MQTISKISTAAQRKFLSARQELLNILTKLIKGIVNPLTRSLTSRYHEPDLASVTCHLRSKSVKFVKDTDSEVSGI